MPATWDIPDYPVVVYGSLETPKRISPSGHVFVDGKVIEESIVVTKAVSVSGSGRVSVTTDVPEEEKPEKAEEPKKAPRKPRPSEIKAKEAKAKKKPAKKTTKKRATKRKAKK